MATNKETGEYERAKDFVNWRSVTADRRISFPAVVSFEKDNFSGKDAEFATLMFGEKTRCLYFGPALPGEEVRVYKGSISQSETIQPTNQFGSFENGFAGHSGGVIDSTISVFIDVNATPEHLSTSKIEEDYHMREIGWQPIETVPTDGSIFLGYDPDPKYGIQTMRVNIHGDIGDPIYSEWTANPTHWKPTGESPKPKKENKFPDWENLKKLY